MAKTRSRGPISPKTPLSEKMKKIKTKTEVEASPSSKKVKKAKVEKPVKKAVKNVSASDTAKTTTKEIVSEKVAKGALEQLKKYVESEEKPTKLELFDDEDDKLVYLQITTKKFYSPKPNFKPKMIKLSNPIVQLDDETKDFKTCLIVRDELITSNEMVEQIEGENISTLSKILTLKDIKTEFKPFEKKRELYSEYDLFLVDDALLNSMPHLLGKVFYDNGNNKIPLPIRVTNSSNTKKLSIDTLKNQIQKCLSSTYFLPPMGVNILIKFGTINKHLINELASNIQDILNSFDVSSLRSVMLKTSTSPALPLFYNDNLYDSEDVIENVKSTKKSDNVELTAYEKGLLEIGTTEDVTKIIGKKLKQKLKNSSH